MGHVKCECSQAVGFYIGAFKAAVEYAMVIESQFTTTAPTTTSTESTETQPKTEPKVSTTPEEIQTVNTLMKFSFQGDFTLITGNMGGVSNAQFEICESVRAKLQLKTAEFKNCTITNGSIIVSFVTVQTPSEATETQQLLIETVENDDFGITTLTGTPLQTQPGSTTINNNSPGDDATSNADEDDMLVLIIVAAVIALVILIVVIIVIIACKKKKEQQVRKLSQCLHFL